MNQRTLSFHPIKCAFVFTLAMAIFESYPLHTLAQPNQPANSSEERLRIRFKQQEEDGSSKGRPGNRIGTATRSRSPESCLFQEKKLTALVPHFQDNPKQSPVALTVEEYPSFWFYVPYKSDEKKIGEWVLQDEQNNDVYRTIFTLPTMSGIVSISLPKKFPLEINKPYQWYFKIYCDSIQSSELIFVRGWVQRVALKLDLESQLKAATERDRIALYAANGIWHTALTDLAKLRLAFPDNASVERDWADLLREVDLEHLAREPLVGSITASFLPEGNPPNNTDFRP